jgi:LysB family phage lysis regulatory protein
VSVLRQWLYGFALLGALSLLIYAQAQRIDAADARASLADERFKAADQRNERQAKVITTLQGELSTERSAQRDLRATQGLLRTALAARDLKIKDLARENEELRLWAHSQLPADARRLRERPALTGADAYRAWLSRSDAMRPSSHSTP